MCIESAAKQSNLPRRFLCLHIYFHNVANDTIGVTFNLAAAECDSVLNG